MRYTNSRYFTLPHQAHFTSESKAKAKDLELISKAKDMSFIVKVKARDTVFSKSFQGRLSNHCFIHYTNLYRPKIIQQ